jgi:hypothetical protein
MKKKGGQIFLIGSFLFVIMILGFGLLQNSIFNDSPNYQFEYLARNVQGEMLKTLEYDLFTGEEVIENFTELTSEYVKESYPNANFIFIYGSEVISFKSYISNPETSLEVEDLSFNQGFEKQTGSYQTNGEILITLNGEDILVQVYPGGIAHFLIILEENNEVFIGFS